MATHFELFADYFQIHLLDDGSEGDLGDVWNEQTVSDGLGVTEDALAIGTAVNSTVAVVVDVLMERPVDDGDAFDHVVEASLRLASGRLVVLGCTDHLPEAARFDVPAGWIRVRASRRNLEAASSADLDCEDEPEEREEVRIQAWPAPYSEPRVVKRWAPAEA
ncbi:MULTISPECIES: hypothetical protein [unclassified Streptomyces]|uniref:hypothetical protein n=1 Tax=unclassified Streptomyces TaxID=2593676 RepID=UPI0033207C90